MDGVVGLLFIVFGLVVFGSIGRRREQAHIRELDAREAQLAGLVVVANEAPPPDLSPVHAQMVMGNAVIGTDYLKQWLANLRMLFGGEMKAYQTVLDRARREAQLRMLEEASSAGARAVVNVRFETSQVASGIPASEVVCYGTLVR